MNMSVTNDSHPPPSSPPCYNTISGLYLISSSTLAYVLCVLPVSLLVVYLGVQRRRRRSVATTTSHSDFFTFNMAAVELVAVVGHVFDLCSHYTNLSLIPILGASLGFPTLFGQILFPILTCVDRYLAVVHPVTYLRLRRAGGVRIRNTSTGCVWLTCCGLGSLLALLDDHGDLPVVGSTLVFSLVVMTFLSLPVLRVLIRPRPGEVGGGRAQGGRSKRRALNTVMVIMAALWLKFGWNVAVVVTMSSSSEVVSVCFVEASLLVVSLPNSLVLFLLFIQRAAKLPGCKHNNEPA